MVQSIIHGGLRPRILPECYRYELNEKGLLWHMRQVYIFNGKQLIWWMVRSKIENWEVPYISHNIGGKSRKRWKMNWPKGRSESRSSREVRELGSNAGKEKAGETVAIDGRYAWRCQPRYQPKPNHVQIRPKPISLKAIIQHIQTPSIIRIQSLTLSPKHGSRSIYTRSNWLVTK